VLNSVKDGVDWTEVTSRPAGLDDGDDVGITSESDPEIGSNTTNYIPKWDGNSLVSGTIFDDGNIGIGRTDTFAKLDLYSPVNNHDIYLDDAYLLWLESGSIGNPLNTIQVIKSYGPRESEIRFDNGDDMLAAIYSYSNDRAINFLVGGIIDGGQYGWVTFENQDSLGNMKVHLRSELTNESALVFHNAAHPDVIGYTSKVYRPSNSNDLVVNLSGIGDVMTFDSISGNVGLGTTMSPSEKLHVNGNITADDYLVNSSREYKEQIETLSTDQAMSTLNDLRPVTFKFKNDMGENHVGFIAEEVPELVASKNRNNIGSMDIIGVLTKVVQEQQKIISELSKRVSEIEKELQLKESLAMTDINER
jgi:hypothetical protein